MNSENKQMYDSAVDNLLKGIGDSYANWGWGKPGPNTDRVNHFRDGLKIKPGRKFDKVIEKNEVHKKDEKPDKVIEEKNDDDLSLDIFFPD